MSKKLSILVLLILALVLPIDSAFAACSGLADQFYGALDIGGQDAPIGSQVRGIILGSDRGSITTDVAGQYGEELTDNKLYVSGSADGSDFGSTISFEVFVNGLWTDSGETSTYQCGETKNLDINVENVPCPDADGDGVCDGADQCPGFDDAQDADGDGTPNGCDACPGDFFDDSDGDGSCDSDDICQGFDDAQDADGDGTPNGCDACPADPTNDLDEDEVCGQSDNCPDDFNPDQDDADEDGIGNECDACTDVDEDNFCLQIDDCDDNNEFVNPDATEVADGIDNDCDGQIDGSSDSVDDDNDGFAENDGDCNDNNSSINPNANELCDNVDNDCNQNTVDGVDEPGYGDQTNCGFGECASVGVFTCVNGDMTDTCQPGPQAIETCDGLDNDCNNVIDNGALLTFFQDFDVDAFGNPIIIQQACQAPQGYVVNDDDCNDNNSSINPGAQEVCDQADNDCDTLVDEGNVCGGVCNDEDQDGVCDNEDLCEGFPNVDDDNDGICNDDDNCPVDPENDADGDGVCESDDECPGFDDTQDADGDGIPDGCDACEEDPLNDADGDGICGDVDQCPGEDDNLDSDNDGIPDGCDACPNDDGNDADGDGVCSNDDVCEGFDDNIDTDADGTPDGCDACPLDDPDDSDSDGACDTDDLCPGFDDSLDSDDDGTPDGCDEDVQVFEGSVTLFNGWTLFALPLNPAVLGINDSEELGQAIIDSGTNCDVIERFNGDTQTWQDDLLGLPDPSFPLAGGVGYFIHCYEEGVFNYQGTVWT